MKPLTERYQADLLGVLSCYDRMIITGTLPGACYASGAKSMGRVENSLSPALSHQTVHAVLRVFASQKPCQPQFPHTAFRCSSRQGMRRFTGGRCRNLV